MKKNPTIMPAETKSPMTAQETAETRAMPIISCPIGNSRWGGRLCSLGIARGGASVAAPPSGTAGAGTAAAGVRRRPPRRCASSSRPAREGMRTAKAE